MRAPRRGVTGLLLNGRLLVAAGLVVFATAVAALSAARFIADTPASSFLYGETRSPLITNLIDTLGRERTAIIGYFIEQAWTAIIVVTALSPILVWILGSTAVHAAARLDGVRRPFRPMFVLFGYAAAITRIPADATAALFGTTHATVGSVIAGWIGTACLFWLGVLAWRAIEVHYAIPTGRAMVVLLIAVLLFYLAPLAVIVVALVAILVAAVLLDYVPGL